MENRMTQDWIEFKKNETDRLNLRSEYIIGISEFPFDLESNMNEHTRILYDAGINVQDIAIAEPYEQVKQKIMDAEKIDYADVAVERFNRDEYKYILDSLSMAHPDLYFPPQDEKQIEFHNTIRKKLNEILKENK